MLSIECQEKCGVAGVIMPPGEDAAVVAALVGAELQHRGQEGGGIGVKKYRGGFDMYKDSQRFGLVFPSLRVLNNLGSGGMPLKGEIALAHTRYRTHGPAHLMCYAHPMLVEEQGRKIMGVHNGNVANAEELYEELKLKGVLFDTEGQVDEKYRPLPVSDSEILFRKIATSSGNSWVERVALGMDGVQGSVSAVLATDQNEMIAFRDPYGIRPLSFGRLNGYYIVSSETHTLDMVGAVDQTEVQKGEIWLFRPRQDPINIIYEGSRPWKFCDFEDWYFSWPSSRRNGITASAVRRECAEQLAEEERRFGRLVEADVTVCAPDSARCGAVRFASLVGVPYEELIYKNRYDEKGNRSFIGSNPALRREVIDKKYLYDPGLRHKVIYLVDDTGVRLDTLKIMSKALRERVGVSAIHARLLAPKFVRPCVLGTNINQRDELGAVQFNGQFWSIKDDIRLAGGVGVDSIAFLTMEGRRRVRERLGEDPNSFCGYCHGDKGPGFDFLRFDPDLIREGYLVAQTV